MNIPRGQGGFTIVEVLVAAVVFLIGFSIMVFMLNQVISRFSIRDITHATRIGEESMESAIAYHDTLSCDTTIVSSSIAYRLRKNATVQEGLVLVRITVSRRDQEKALCRLYGEYCLP